MKFTLTSPSGTILDTDSLIQATVMTETGEITILPDHEPLLSVVRPGILVIFYTEQGQEKTGEYVLGGGALSVDSDSCTLISDLVQGEFKDDDLENIEAQKKDAERIIREHNEANGEVDPRRQLELEYNLLHHQARHELWNRIKSPTAGRK